MKVLMEYFGRSHSLVTVVLLVCMKDSKNCDQIITQYLEMKLLQIVLISFHSLGIAKIRLYNIFSRERNASPNTHTRVAFLNSNIIISKMY